MAIEISADTQWLSLPSRSSRGFTLTFWFRYDASGTSGVYNTVCCVHGTGLVGFVVDRAANRANNEIGLWSDSDINDREIARVNPGIWYFGCLVVDSSGNAKVGIGSRDASGNGFIDFTAAGTITSYSSTVTFGTNDWGWWFDGAIADIRLAASTALSDSALIVELESNAPVSASITSWFRLNSNTDLTDQSGAVTLTQN